jgi:hypothetical protein
LPGLVKGRQRASSFPSFLLRALSLSALARPLLLFLVSILSRPVCRRLTPAARALPVHARRPAFHLLLRLVRSRCTLGLRDRSLAFIRVGPNVLSFPIRTACPFSTFTLLYLPFPNSPSDAYLRLLAHSTLHRYSDSSSIQLVDISCDLPAFWSSSHSLKYKPAPEATLTSPYLAGLDSYSHLLAADTMTDWHGPELEAAESRSSFFPYKASYSSLPDSRYHQPSPCLCRDIHVSHPIHFSYIDPGFHITSVGNLS